MSTVEIIHLDETSSTNDYLKGYKPKADITAVYADYQSAGRGQSGAWYSPKGENLMFSLLVTPPDLPIADSFIISQAMALALKDAIQEFAGNVEIKWPNDIYVGGHKMCGTLIENTLHGKMLDRCIIGTGVNINQKIFPEGLAAPPTSIYLLSGKQVEPEKLLKAIMTHFQPYYDAIVSYLIEPSNQRNADSINKIRTLYHHSLYLKGSPHLFEDGHGQFIGTISHVENNGHIIITDDSGNSRSYGFKEVKLIHNKI